MSRLAMRSGRRSTLGPVSDSQGQETLGQADHELFGEGEELDGLPVLDDERLPAPVAHGPSSALAQPPARALPAVAAVAATSFVAGAAVVGLVHRHRRRRALAPARGRRAREPRGTVGELVQIVGTRSLLVDVHLLGGRER